MNRITEVLSVEWARYGINVNAIAPGAFHSEMMDGMISRIGDFTQMTPRKRLGEPAQLDSDAPLPLRPRLGVRHRHHRPRRRRPRRQVSASVVHQRYSRVPSSRSALGMTSFSSMYSCSRRHGASVPCFGILCIERVR